MVAAAVRFGLVGYGFGGRYFHAPLIAAAPGCELVGVVTTAPARRDELAREQPGVPAYDSLRALADAGVAAVAISTPADTHVPLAREAIGLGLAVVVDKPFALDPAAARETVELAERSGVVLSGSSPASSGSSRSRGRRRPVAAPCSISAATWWTRP
jgi:predicted dehydrogenase